MPVVTSNHDPLINLTDSNYGVWWATVIKILTGFQSYLIVSVSS